jgi:hypothetical protein
MPFPSTSSPTFSDCTAASDEWGDTTAGWRADFFRPMAPLLRSAAWIVLRGNHEVCRRAGMGWFRYLDPAPLAQVSMRRSPWCLSTTPTYRVSMSQDEAIVIDSAFTVKGAISIDQYSQQAYSGWSGAPSIVPPMSPICIDEENSTNSTLPNLEARLASVAALATDGLRKWILTHQPIYGLVCQDHGNGSELFVFDCPIINAAAAAALNVSGVYAFISGHKHVFQFVAYEGDDRPPQIAVGNSGTQLQNPQDGSPNNLAAAKGGDVVGTVIAEVVEVGQFGFATIELKNQAGPLLTAQFMSDRAFTGAANVTRLLTSKNWIAKGRY